MSVETKTNTAQRHVVNPLFPIQESESSTIDEGIDHLRYTTTTTPLPENKKKNTKNNKKTIKTHPGGKTKGGYRNAFIENDNNMDTSTTFLPNTLVHQTEITIEDSPIQLPYSAKKRGKRMAPSSEDLKGKTRIRTRGNSTWLERCNPKTGKWTKVKRLRRD